MRDGIAGILPAGSTAHQQPLLPKGTPFRRDGIWV